ncbi:TIGR02466 family protein [Streptomyces sp. NPDC091416]|uniref:TIGR02466 family protein n=1 Tax=Streptomyces sp. NPDC091416 TaxID=3366003 RepID=UPI00382C4178
MFSTPVARMLFPYADEVAAPLTERILQRPGAMSKDFGYKTETAGELVRWGGEPAVRLTRWVCAAAGRFVESLTGLSLSEAFERSAGLEGEEGTQGRQVRVAASRSWASVYRPGDRHEAHFHPNTALSAVYYVTAPNLCEINFLDPRPNVDYFDSGISLAGDSHRTRITCKPGELVIFPGWLRHSVPTFHEESKRISIAWNLNYVLD